MPSGFDKLAQFRSDPIRIRIDVANVNTGSGQVLRNLSRFPTSRSSSLLYDGNRAVEHDERESRHEPISEARAGWNIDRHPAARLGDDHGATLDVRKPPIERFPMKMLSRQKNADIPTQEASLEIAGNKFETSHRRGPPVVVGPSPSCRDPAAWLSAEKLAAEMERQGNLPLVLFKTPPSGLPADDRCMLEREELIYDYFQEQQAGTERVPEAVRGVVSAAPYTIVAPFPTADLEFAAEACRKAERSLAVMSSDQVIEARLCRELMSCADQIIIRLADFESLFNVWHPEEDLAVNEISGDVVVLGDDRVTLYRASRAVYQLPVPFGCLNQPDALERFIASWVKADLNDVGLPEALTAAVAVVSGVDPEVGATFADEHMLDDIITTAPAGPISRWTYSLSTTAAAVGFIAGWTVSHF
jgi:hypothetical protein